MLSIVVYSVFGNCSCYLLLPLFEILYEGWPYWLTGWGMTMQNDRIWLSHNVAIPRQFWNCHILGTRRATRHESEFRPGNETHGAMAKRIDAYLAWGSLKLICSMRYIDWLFRLLVRVLGADFPSPTNQCFMRYLSAVRFRMRLFVRENHSSLSILELIANTRSIRKSVAHHQWSTTVEYQCNCRKVDVSISSTHRSL